MEGNEATGTEATGAQAGAESATGSAPPLVNASTPTAAVEPQTPAKEEKPAAGQPGADNDVKVTRAEWEQTTKDAGEFRKSQNTEAKLKGRYAKLEFVSKYCQNMPRDLCMQILPDTEDENALHKANKALSDSICAFMRECAAKGQISYRSVGGSAGGHAPRGGDNSRMTAGQLFGQRQR